MFIVTEFVADGALDKFLIDNNNKLSEDTLIQMTKELAAVRETSGCIVTHMQQGMDHLSAHSIVHRDLAARNLLLEIKRNGDHRIKVCDFGLSRGLTENEYSSKMKNIPVRWTAPEAFKFKKYTTKSDVWSFAVTVWEIFSFGQTPYTGHSAYEVIELLVKGYRLAKPPACPDLIYNSIILACLQDDPEQRPTFNELYHLLEELYPSKGTRINSGGTSAVFPTIQMAAAAPPPQTTKTSAIASPKSVEAKGFTSTYVDYDRDKEKKSKYDGETNKPDFCLHSTAITPLQTPDSTPRDPEGMVVYTLEADALTPPAISSIPATYASPMSGSFNRPSASSYGQSSSGTASDGRRAEGFASGVMPRFDSPRSNQVSQVKGPAPIAKGKNPPKPNLAHEGTYADGLQTTLSLSPTPSPRPAPRQVDDSPKLQISVMDKWIDDSGTYSDSTPSHPSLSMSTSNSVTNSSSLDDSGIYSDHGPTSSPSKPTASPLKESKATQQTKGDTQKSPPYMDRIEGIQPQDAPSTSKPKKEKGKTKEKGKEKGGKEKGKVKKERSKGKDNEKDKSKSKEKKSKSKDTKPRKNA